MPDERELNDEREFAKQLVLYADAITAFAVVQLLAFVYLLAHGDCFTANVLHNVWYPVIGSIIIYFVYLGFVLLCRRGEIAIFTLPRSKVLTRIADRAWKARYAIIAGGLVFTVILLFWVSHDIKNGVFLLDCKVKEKTCCGSPDAK
jgi:hypothetical protein